MSEMAAERLVELGYTQIVNLQGGMAAWEEAGLPLETDQKPGPIGPGFLS